MSNKLKRVISLLIVFLMITSNLTSVYALDEPTDEYVVNVDENSTESFDETPAADESSETSSSETESSGTESSESELTETESSDEESADDSTEEVTSPKDNSSDDVTKAENNKESKTELPKSSDKNDDKKKEIKKESKQEIKEESKEESKEDSKEESTDSEVESEDEDEISEEDDAIFEAEAGDVLADGIYTIAFAKNNNYVLDISAASKNSGANLQLYKSNNTVAQKFRIQKDTDGKYIISNMNSNKVVDVTGAKDAKGANVQQYAANTTKAQKWVITKEKDGFYRIKSAMAGGRYLSAATKKAANHVNIQLGGTDKNSDTTKFAIKKVGNAPSYAGPGKTLNIANGVYEFRSSLDSAMVLDIAGASIKNGANAQLYTTNNTVAQRFRVKKGSDGKYTILNIKSGLALDIKGASRSSKANVWQYKPNGTVAQKWTFFASGDGHVVVKSELGTVLDIAGARMYNGTNIWAYSSNGTKAQFWSLHQIVEPKKEEPKKEEEKRAPVPGENAVLSQKVIPDISRYRPVRNWSLTKQNVHFLISKATQGTTHVDPTLREFINNCEKYKIPYWVYTFLEAGDELEQARFMVDTCRPYVGKYFCGYILDVEAEYVKPYKANDPEDIAEALNYLKKTGKKAMVYINYSRYDMYKDVIDNRGDRVAWWEARYGKNNGLYEPDKYPSHEGCDLHQYTSKGSCPGIAVFDGTYGLDLNRLNGNKSLKWFMTP